jgi:hypothetical protein
MSPKKGAGNPERGIRIPGVGLQRVKRGVS